MYPFNSLRLFILAFKIVCNFTYVNFIIMKLQNLKMIQIFLIAYISVHIHIHTHTYAYIVCVLGRVALELVHWFSLSGSPMLSQQLDWYLVFPQASWSQ